MIGPAVTPTARLEIARAVFVEEVTRMSKVLGRSRSGDALLMFRDGALQIRMPGAETTMPAQGRWPGEARVAASWVRALGKVPPTQDPIVIQVYGGRLHIAGSSNTCRWQAAGKGTVEVTLGMSLLDLVKLDLAHSDEVLEASGLTPAIVEARQKIDKRIKAAARQLSTLGISETDLRLLITGKLGAG